MPTLEKAKSHYESTWSRVNSIVTEEMKAGKSRTEILTTIVDSLSARFLSIQPFLDLYEDLGIEFEAAQAPKQRVAVIDGAYELRPFSQFGNDLVCSTIGNFLDRHIEDIDCIVELGSGYGRNLFSIHDTLKHRFSIPKMHACELTESGRQVTKDLRQMDSEISLDIHSFDYFNPDFSFLDENSNVLLLTVHSIEQIPLLKSPIFEKLISKVRKCNCFHFEPVGWQTDRQVLNKRNSPPVMETVTSRLRTKSREIFSKILKRKSAARGFENIELQSADIGSSRRVSSNASAWSMRAGYNTDLVSVLRSLEQRKMMTIQSGSINKFGANPFNPTSVFHWESK